ncbi:hypothetical protein ILUMI_11499 [Ignelater luminosus]|uniref:Uncharacterized protein n=1 Tax=Ignelater luminosus TaxID=2038154 RepID=A0A8K0GAF8_IGNLU|nr:hypothetical protein ILUMI_11499 [Ignelater luminosus]
MDKPFVLKCPRKIISVDLVGPLLRSPPGHQFIFVETNISREFSLLFLLRQAAAPDICRLLEEHVFLLFAVPRSSKAITVQFPSKEVISTYVSEEHHKWDADLSALACALRTAKHEDLELECSQSEGPSPERASVLNRLRSQVRERLIKSHQNSQSRYNRRRPDAHYNVLLLTTSLAVMKEPLEPRNKAIIAFMKDENRVSKGNWHFKDPKLFINYLDPGVFHHLGTPICQRASFEKSQLTECDHLYLEATGRLTCTLLLASSAIFRNQRLSQIKNSRTRHRNIIIEGRGVNSVAKTARAPYETWKLFINNEIIEGSIRNNFVRTRDALDTDTEEIKALFGLLYQLHYNSLEVDAKGSAVTIGDLSIFTKSPEEGYGAILQKRLAKVMEHRLLEAQTPTSELYGLCTLIEKLKDLAEVSRRPQRLLIRGNLKKLAKV